MAKRKPYSRKRLKQRINGLTEILQDGVAAGDLPEIAVSHTLYTLSNFEMRLAEQEALKRLDDLPPARSVLTSGKSKNTPGSRNA